MTTNKRNIIIIFFITVIFLFLFLVDKISFMYINTPTTRIGTIFNAYSKIDSHRIVEASDTYRWLFNQKKMIAGRYYSDNKKRVFYQYPAESNSLLPDITTYKLVPGITSDNFRAYQPHTTETFGVAGNKFIIYGQVFKTFDSDITIINNFEERYLRTTDKIYWMRHDYVNKYDIEFFEVVDADLETFVSEIYYETGKGFVYTAHDKNNYFLNDMIVVINE